MWWLLICIWLICGATQMCEVPDHFTCTDSHCIPAWWRCDGDTDCSDGSDEFNCDYVPRNMSRTCRTSEFQCKYEMRCIPSVLVCDGHNDCIDAGDEAPEICPSNLRRKNQLKCKDPQDIPMATTICNGQKSCLDLLNCARLVCDKTEFNCDGLCIPLSKVCDGHPDCPNLEDEPPGRCGIDECGQNNGGCTQKCVDTLVGYYCYCDKGYKLVNNRSCEVIDECLDLGTCSQICVNGNVTFTCECHPGYTKNPFDQTRCKATEGHPILLLARRMDIRKISLDHLEIVDVVSDTEFAVALDYHFKTGMVFWSNFEEQKIYMSPIHEERNGKSVVISDQIIAEGLAVDWIYNRLYWTDGVKKHIQLSDLQGNMRKILIQDNLFEPLAIAVNPLEGWMYWTDVGEIPRIERAGMDGSHRQTIVTKDLTSPNSLTLDLVRKRLYWVDLYKISSCNYDGSARLVILLSPFFLGRPFSITTFEDWVYWTDWNRGAVYRANKFHGNHVQLIITYEYPVEPFLNAEDMRVIKVYHPYRQPDGVNHCSNVSCSHWCLPAPQLAPDSPKVTCSCPNGSQLLSDNRTCNVANSACHVDTSVVKVGAVIAGVTILLAYERYSQ